MKSAMSWRLEQKPIFTLPIQTAGRGSYFITPIMMCQDIMLTYVSRLYLWIFLSPAVRISIINTFVNMRIPFIIAEPYWVESVFLLFPRFSFTKDMGHKGN